MQISHWLNADASLVMILRALREILHGRSFSPSTLLRDSCSPLIPSLSDFLKTFAVDHHYYRDQVERSVTWERCNQELLRRPSRVISVAPRRRVYFCRRHREALLATTVVTVSKRVAAVVARTSMRWGGGYGGTAGVTGAPRRATSSHVPPAIADADADADNSGGGPSL